MNELERGRAGPDAAVDLLCLPSTSLVQSRKCLACLQLWLARGPPAATDSSWAQLDGQEGRGVHQEFCLPPTTKPCFSKSYISFYYLVFQYLDSSAVPVFQSPFSNVSLVLHWCRIDGSIWEENRHIMLPTLSQHH